MTVSSTPLKCSICAHISNKTGRSQVFARFYQCSKCFGLFLKKGVVVRYKENYFQQKNGRTIIAGIVQPLLDLFYWLRVKRINFLLVRPQSCHVLDYGCGAGKLVEYLVKDGISAVGFDPSPSAVRLGRKNRLPVFSTIKPTHTGYDLVMFWHSLEHIHNPLKVIRGITKYLKKGGKVLIAVPNIASFEAILARDKWFHYSYPLHQVHFTPKALREMLKKCGFKNIEFDFLNPEYTLTGLVQSLLNILFPKDVLYSMITHRRLTIRPKKALVLSVLSLFLITLLFPIIILFYIFALIFRKTGAMVVVAQYG